MRILVTGGAGFIGNNLIKSLLKKGHEVISVDDYSTGKKENHIEGCQYIQRDILDIDPNDFIYKPDLVYHLAAKARIQPSFEQPEEYIRVNYEGTLNMIKLCLKENISLIGMAGVGKTALGKKLASYYRKKFIDIDYATFIFGNLAHLNGKDILHSETT